jgi:hypothetical protein
MFKNPNEPMYNNRNQTVNSFGKDNTGLIKYTFDRFGFRDNNNYEIYPEYVFFGVSLLFGIGVDSKKTFSSKFNCWNFGLAGRYTEQQIIECYELFKKLQVKTKIVFVWRDYDAIPSELLNDNFHCIPLRSEKRNHVRLLEKLDHDVSKTHWGTKTHNKFYKILCHFLK